MVLGNYYITMEEAGREGEGMVFSNADEAEVAWRNGFVHLHTRVGIATKSLNKPWTADQKDKIMVTTVGKILFNAIMPEEFPYLNEPTQENLTSQTDDRFFMAPGENVIEFIQNHLIWSHHSRKNIWEYHCGSLQTFPYDFDISKCLTV
jgi:DNA-directed RNA polymerase subunit beta'